MTVTRKDVADAAGVSPAVVSYVLNDGPRGVAPATRAQVLEAVQRLGYRPNRIAASLRSKRTHSLGLIVPDNTNPYFAELAREVEEEAFRCGYTLLLGNAVDDVDREGLYLREFLDRQVDGLFVIPSHDGTLALAEVVASRTPMVILDREVLNTEAPAQLLSDNRAGGELATRHLLDHGRRRIGCIAGPRDARNAERRVAGWRDALADGTDGACAGPLIHVPITRFAGRQATLSVLREDPRVDALFVASDEQAIGVLRALRELGLDCPRDVAVVAFDGTSYASLMTPGLTTVRQPIAMMAKQGVGLIMAQRSEDWRPSPPRFLPVELTVRGSCGCADDFEGASAPEGSFPLDQPEEQRS